MGEYDEWFRRLMPGETVLLREYRGQPKVATVLRLTATGQVVVQEGQALRRFKSEGYTSAEIGGSRFYKASLQPYDEEVVQEMALLGIQNKVYAALCAIRRDQIADLTYDPCERLLALLQELGLAR